jgi:hypothetical protein
MTRGPSSVSVEAAACEFGGVPRFVLYGAVESPQLPNEPAIVVIRRRHDNHEPVGWSVRALKRAIVQLLVHRPAPWLVETHTEHDFQKAWESLRLRCASEYRYGTDYSSELPVLLYTPHHGRSEPTAHTLHLAQELLERLEAPPNRVESGSSAGAANAPPAADSPNDSADISVSLARDRRAELLRDEQWLTAEQVHERLGGKPDAPGAKNRASRLRKAGELLGVWDGRRYVYPLFQFYPNSQGGQLVAGMESLIKVLPKDTTGWRQAFWLCQPHAGLDGERPADALQRDPQSVIRAAHSTFEPGNEHW